MTSTTMTALEMSTPVRLLIACLLLASQGCQRHVAYASDVEPEIVGGEPAYKGEFPFYVQLLDSVLCGGTLIHPRVVLSAAHCGPEGTEWIGTTARISAFKFDPNEKDGSIKRTVVDQKNHPYYNNLNLNNDFMLLRLNQDAPTSAIIALSDDPADIAGGVLQTAVGMGLLTLGGSVPKQLLKVEGIPAFSDTECLDLLGTLLPDKIFGIDTETMVCAGESGRGTCDGDSGGPLFTLKNGVPTQTGVTSFGRGCESTSDPYIPSVYSNIPETGYAWIQSVLNEWFPTTATVAPTPAPTKRRKKVKTSAPTLAPTLAPTPAPTPAPTKAKKKTR